jgi:hypothetical protein
LETAHDWHVRFTAADILLEVIVHPITPSLILCDQIKRHLEQIYDFLQSCSCCLLPPAFQIGNVTLSNLGLVRDVELRFTASLAERAQRVLSAGDSINDLFRNEWHAGGNLFSRPRNQARSAEVFVGFSRLGGKNFVFLARKDRHLALVGLFKLNTHVAILSPAPKVNRLFQDFTRISCCTRQFN